ncbi:hypothetical protein HDU99_004573, partial [Rhizoclosmatium hyalinum]
MPDLARPLRAFVEANASLVRESVTECLTALAAEDRRKKEAELVKLSVDAANEANAKSMDSLLPPPPATNSKEKDPVQPVATLTTSVAMEVDAIPPEPVVVVAPSVPEESVTPVETKTLSDSKEPTSIPSISASSKVTNEEGEIMEMDSSEK